MAVAATVSHHLKQLVEDPAGQDLPVLRRIDDVDARVRAPPAGLETG